MFVPIGMQNLEKGLVTFLKSQGIALGEVHTYGTPRRLSIIIKDLALEKPTQKTEKKGPALEQAFDAQGKATQAEKVFSVL